MTAHLLRIHLLLCATTFAAMSDSRYDANRAQILANERSTSIAGASKTSASEEYVERWLRKLKHDEYHNFDDEHFLPAQDFLSVRENISNSRLLGALKLLPKGASLHTHILAATSAEFIIKELTYIDDLYMYEWNGRTKLKFMNASAARDHPEPVVNVATARANRSNFDDWLLQKMTITSADRTKAARWTKLSNVFTLLFDMLTYRPVFELYLTQAMRELQEENVCYAEFRGTFMEFYELDGSKHDVMESLRIMENVIDAYTANNTDFIGAKYIFAPYRQLNDTAFHDAMRMLHDAHRKHPRLVIGFDMVGHEDAGGVLRDRVAELQRVHKEIRFYFHAGETKWHGTPADDNILDAVMLGASRIGHALSLVRHPEAMRLVRERKIAIEVAPVSNQVMGYVTDLRDHPAVVYARYGIPLVLCNDDPTAFGTVGLRYDYYAAFMAFTRVDEGLEFLKVCAMNSIGYSAMTNVERQRATEWYYRKLEEYDLYIRAISSLFRWVDSTVKT